MKRRAFPGFGPEIEARYLRAGNWLRATIFESAEAREWCSINGVRIAKAAAEGIGSAGEFLVPTEFANAILDLREQYGVFRRNARIWPMASNHTRTPRRPGGTSAVFVGENVAATETSGVVDSIGLTAKKIAALVRLSTEVAEDSLPDIVDYVANEIAYAFASKEDDCAFNGDGTSTYGGMRGIAKIVLDGNHAAAKVVAASGHNTYLTLDGTDLANLVAAIRASAVPNAAWYVSQTGFAQTFCRLAGAGGYIYAGSHNGEPAPFYLGFPVVLTQKFPLVATSVTGQAMLAFGDMYAAGILGQRRAVTLARSDDRYMDNDQIAVLGTERFATVIHDIGDATNAGSIAALVAP